MAVVFVCVLFFPLAGGFFFGLRDVFFFGGMVIVVAALIVVLLLQTTVKMIFVFVSEFENTCQVLRVFFCSRAVFSLLSIFLVGTSLLVIDF